MRTDSGQPVRIIFADFPQDIQGKVRGVTRATAKGYTVLIDSSRPAQTQRHTIGHELAHIFLKHFEISSDIAAIEREANKKAWHYYRLYKEQIRSGQG